MATIFALSSGRPPAAIAIVRISGDEALTAARRLAGPLPAARRATLRALRDADGRVLDHALVIVFPAPNTATGEDLVELHLHGGRAVVAAVERVLASMPGLRAAEPGEFTRRGLEHGRIDLAQAQGLADLLTAETEGQRRAAMAAADGAVGRALSTWHVRLAQIAGQIEAAIDYADEGDVEATAAETRAPLAALHAEIVELVGRPTVERLRDGPIVVLAGPPNAGKSSLFNALIAREAAIVSEIAGTTRDVLEAAVVRRGQAYRLVDTAGLHEAADDPVERIGIERAGSMVASADLVLWLGAACDCPAHAVLVAAKADENAGREGLGVSIRWPRSVDQLWCAIEQRVGERPYKDDVRLHERQRAVMGNVADELLSASLAHDPLIVAEHVRCAMVGIGELLGRNATEAMLDALFSQFCVGK